MADQELIKALRENAEWAHANEWETPITLGDNLEAAADRLEALLAENAELRKADVSGVRPELRKAVKLLEKNYERGLNSDYVRNPVAWALYQTWKQMDGGADNG